MNPDHGPHTTLPRDPGPYATCPAWSGRPLTDLSWQHAASCATADPDLFHPEAQEGYGTPTMIAIPQAKTVCTNCPVRLPCLVWALEHREKFGVWGGCSRTQRAKIIADFPADTNRAAA